MLRICENFEGTQKLGTGGIYCELLLLIMWQEGHPACKKRLNNSQKFTLKGHGLKWCTS